MNNILNILKDVFTEFADNEPTNPMHVGEVMNFWTYLTMLEEANRYVETALNTTTDDELITLLKQSFDNCHKQIEEIQSFLRTEGIPLPPTSKRKPYSAPNAVPFGVKLTDDEIADGIALKSVSSIVFCATGLSQSIRPDIGSMWLRFFMIRVKYNARLYHVMKRRGWLKIPPYYYPPGMPDRP